GAPLGLVRRGARSGGWLRWLAACPLEVCETEDAALLCVVRPVGWRRRAWRVLDAEERLAGIVRREVLLARYGNCLALVRREAAGRSVAFVSPEGLPLGALAPSAGGAVLTFAASVTNDPFARMVLLAAALTRTG